MANSEKTRFEIVTTAFGPAAVVGGTDGVAGVVLPGLDRRGLAREVRRRWPGAKEDGRGLRLAAGALRRYFESGRLTGRPVKLDLSGVGEFRAGVYEALREIPPGETVTYAELARRVGRPGAHRSVGTALSRNPVPVFVPCHRVVRTDGGMGGFTAEGGIELKRKMLELEGAIEQPVK
jgi:methylated-DNA-[protein]-cysteine S-methyltransferase